MALTQEKLDNCDLDVISIADVVNSAFDAASIVTRTGRIIPPLARINSVAGHVDTLLTDVASLKTLSAVSGQTRATVVAAKADATIPNGSTFFIPSVTPGAALDVWFKTNSTTANDTGLKVADVSGFATSYDDLGRLSHLLRTATPNNANPVVIIRVSNLRQIWRCPCQYTSGIRSRNDNFFEIEVFNAGPAMGVSTLWTFNSIRIRSKGEIWAAAEFSIETISGANSNTGLVPSTMEYAIEAGVFGDPVDGTHYVYAGVWHGHITPNVQHCFLNGSNVIDYATDANFPVTSALWGTSFSLQYTSAIKSYDNAHTLCLSAVTLTMDSTGVTLAIDHDFGDVSVNATPAIRNAYVGLLAGTSFDFIKPVGQAAFDISTLTVTPAGGSSVDHGQITSFSAYNNDTPGTFVKVTCGFGSNCQYNGVNDNWAHCVTANVLTIREAYGSKTHIYGFSPSGTTVTNVSGKVLRQNIKYQGYVGVAP